MPTIIEQLQIDAADPAVPVTTLLRRAKIAAAKLRLERLEQWMELELQGYPDETPEYRTTFGQVIPSH
jgi:hypothetical protein